MKILTLDVENTMYKHQQADAAKHQVKNEEGVYNPSDRVGQAFCIPQFLVMIGLKWFNKDAQYYLNLSNSVECTQHIIDQSDLIVGFHIKHDLHWLRRVGVNLSGIKIWDCQLAEFILEAQQNPYPSLNKTCEKYGLPLKLDVIENDYWGKGIDTDEIPIDVLWEYLQGDLSATESIFIKQAEQFKISLRSYV